MCVTNRSTIGGVPVSHYHVCTMGGDPGATVPDKIKNLYVAVRSGPVIGILRNYLKTPILAPYP